jgi:hypothetical protein
MPYARDCFQKLPHNIYIGTIYRVPSRNYTVKLLVIYILS